MSMARHVCTQCKHKPHVAPTTCHSSTSTTTTATTTSTAPTVLGGDYVLWLRSPLHLPQLWTNQTRCAAEHACQTHLAQSMAPHPLPSGSAVACSVSCWLLLKRWAKTIGFRPATPLMASSSATGGHAARMMPQRPSRPTLLHRRLRQTGQTQQPRQCG